MGQCPSVHRIYGRSTPHACRLPKGHTGLHLCYWGHKWNGLPAKPSEEDDHADR